MAAEKPKRSKLRLFLLGIGLVFAILTFINQQQRMQEIEAERKQLNEALMRMQNETQRLERLISYSQTDAYIEQTARNRLGWLKPGDILFAPESED